MVSPKVRYRKLDFFLYSYNLGESGCSFVSSVQHCSEVIATHFFLRYDIFSLSSFRKEKVGEDTPKLGKGKAFCCSLLSCEVMPRQILLQQENPNGEMNSTW